MSAADGHPATHEADAVHEPAEVATGRAARAEHWLGLTLVLAAVVAWSMTGFFTRAVSVDAWTTIAVRSFFGGVALTVLFLAYEGRRSWALMGDMKRPAYLHVGASIVCSMATIGSLHNTTVANNTVLFACSPFAAAALARIFLGERVPLRTLLAGAAAMAGVVVVVGGSLGQGRLLGDGLGVMMTLAFAGMIVITRGNPGMPMLPPAILNAVLNVLIALPFADLAGTSVRDYAILAAFGVTNFVLASLLFYAGARRLPAAEAGLLITLDIVMAPFIVWAAFGEDPGVTGMIGAAIVFSAVVAHVLAGMRAEARP